MPADEPPDVFALLDDEYARGILRATHSTAMSARELADALDASRPTIYRRIEQLKALEFVVESPDMDPEGHHRSVYRSRLERVLVKPSETGFSVMVTRSDHPADRFTDMWEQL